MIKIKQFFTSKLFKNSSIYFLITFASKIIPFFILPLMTKYLSPEQYGIAAMYQMYMVMILLIVGFELNRYLDVYYFKVSKKEFEKYLSTIISVVFISSLFFTTVVLFFSLFIEIPNINYYWIGILPIVVMIKFIYGINDNLLRNEEKPILYGKYTIGETVFISLISLLLAYCYHDWTSKAYGFVITIIVLGFFSYRRLRQEYNLQFFIDSSILKKAIIYSMPFVFGLNLANIIFANSDKIILLHFYDYTVVGIFTVALVFASIVGFVTDSFMKAWIPTFYKKLHSDDKTIDQQSLYVFIGLAMLSIVTIFVLMYIMKYMIDEKYYDAIEIMPYIGMAYVFRIAEQLLLQYINFYEKTTKLYFVIIIAILSCVFSAYFLVDLYGIIGMAYSISLFYILLIGYYFYIFKTLRK